MAASSEPTINHLDSTLRNRITRYLHTGNEVPKYYPGCWSAHYFKTKDLNVLQEIDNKKQNVTEVVNIIIKAYKDKMYSRYDTIAFTLAQCIQIGKASVREASYKAASEICNTPEELMLFNKFTRVLRTGNGRGWCKHIQMWYTKKKPMDLAKDMSRVKARHGRSHKTLLRKSHVKIPDEDHARDMVVKYAIFGLKRAKTLKENSEGIQDICSYIEVVENLRHCEDPIAAAEMVAKNNFSLDHIPGHLLTSQEVWNSLMPQFTLGELLYNIQRIHNMGFLSVDSPTVDILTSLLNNQDLIKKSDVTPIQVYITTKNYLKNSRPLKFAKAKVAQEKQTRRRTRQTLNPNTGQWEWTDTKRHPKEAKYWGVDQPPNDAVIKALSKLLDEAWALSPPTNARYLITLDMRNHMFKGRHFCKSYKVPKKGKKSKPKLPSGGEGSSEKKESKKRLLAECFYNRNVTPGHAAIILALQLLKREKDTTLAVFTEQGIEVVELERNFTNIDEAEYVLRKLNLGRVQMDAPIDWARKNSKMFDVFINMVDRPSRYMELDKQDRGGRGPGGRFGPPPPASKELVDHCPVRALERYREDYVREAKLIVLSLASIRVGTTDGSHEGVLDIIGLDEHVPKVMDAFALGQFK